MTRLAVVPPLLLFCTDLLFQMPSSLALPVLQRNPQMELVGTTASLEPVVSRRRSNQIVHHPTGKCILRGSWTDPLTLGSCDRSDFWNYTPQKFLTVKGTYFCLQAVGSSKPAKLGIVCTEDDSAWEAVPGPKSKLQTKLLDGQSLCLDFDSEGKIITNPCSGKYGSDNQWFEVISVQRALYETGALPAKDSEDSP